MDPVDRKIAAHRIRSIIDARLNGIYDNNQFGKEIKIVLQTLIDNGTSITELQEIASEIGLDLDITVQNAN